MKLEKLLAQKKTAIIKKWFDLVVDTYPADTSRFLKSQKDPFANPVGGTTRRGLESLLDELRQGFDCEAAAASLDPIIRIRAVQDFTPSEATGFILSLKSIIRDILSPSLQDNELSEEFRAFEYRIDTLCLLAFDIYVKCREKIFQIKATEQQNRVFKAFEKAGLVTGLPDIES